MVCSNQQYKKEVLITNVKKLQKERKYLKAKDEKKLINHLKEEYKKLSPIQGFYFILFILFNIYHILFILSSFSIYLQ